MRNEFTLTWSESIPPDTRIVEGRWWKPPFPVSMISVGEEAARQFKIRIGSILEFDASGRTVRGKVANVRSIEFSRPGISNQFIFSPGSLSDVPVSYIGTVRMDPSRVADFQSALFKQYPGITSIDVGQVLVRIQELLDKISAVIHFVAVFAIISGIIILASSVVSTRHQRMKEAILFKTLGATRRQVLGIQAAEFLILGSAAGLVGGTLAAITAYFLLGKLLDTEFAFQWIPLLTGDRGDGTAVDRHGMAGQPRSFEPQAARNPERKLIFPMRRYDRTRSRVRLARPRSARIFSEGNPVLISHPIASKYPAFNA